MNPVFISTEMLLVLLVSHSASWRLSVSPHAWLELVWLFVKLCVYNRHRLHRVFLLPNQYPSEPSWCAVKSSSSVRTSVVEQKRHFSCTLSFVIEKYINIMFAEGHGTLTVELSNMVSRRSVLTCRFTQICMLHAKMCLKCAHKVVNVHKIPFSTCHECEKH